MESRMVLEKDKTLVFSSRTSPNRSSKLWWEEEGRSSSIWNVSSSTSSSFFDDIEDTLAKFGGPSERNHEFSGDRDLFLKFVVVVVCCCFSSIFEKTRRTSFYVVSSSSSVDNYYYDSLHHSRNLMMMMMRIWFPLSIVFSHWEVNSERFRSSRSTCICDFDFLSFETDFSDFLRWCVSLLSLSMMPLSYYLQPRY